MYVIQTHFKGNNLDYLIVDFKLYLMYYLQWSKYTLTSWN